MNPLLLVSLTALVRFCLSQEPVPIEFQTDPVLVQTGTDILFTIINLPEVLLVTWDYPGGSTPLAFWSGSVPGSGVVDPPSQYQGRVSITRNQLRISNAQLSDAGSYTVTVNPTTVTGLGTNSRNVQVQVFVAVSGVSLAVPTVAVEGRNISLTCSFATGTEVAVAWGFEGAAITSGGRITISGGSLVIDPGRRADAGQYSCTVSNPVSARSAMQTLTVFYGPDTPVLTKDRPVECVGGGDAVLGQTVTLTCVSESLPPALFTWQQDGRPVAAVQPDNGVLGVQLVSANQSGRYTCLARNAITEGVSEQSTEVGVVQTCLSGGEVAGIVIGSLAALLLIILLILLLVFCCRMKREEEATDQTNGVPRPVPPAPSVQGSDPPLHELRHHYSAPQQYSHHPQNNTMLPRDRLQNLPPPYHHENGNARLLSSTAIPPDGVHNPGFSQNPNIRVQGATRDGSQPPTVQVNLGSRGVAAGALPIMHFNLNSFPPGAQPIPLQTPPGPEASQTQPGDPRRSHDDPGRQRSDPERRVFGREVTGGRSLVPTGYSHRRSPRADSHASQRPHTDRNGNTHPSHRNTDPDTERPDRGPDGRARDGGQTSTHSQGQAPWDLLRGTPAYPNDPAPASDGSDYTTRDPRLSRTRASEPQRVQPEGRGRQEVLPDTRQARPRPHLSHDARREIVTETATGPRGHLPTRSPDTRALADPNHLLQSRPFQTQPTFQQPSQPFQQPSQPVQQPSQPVQQPSQPVQQPSQPFQQPSQSFQQPSQPVPQQTQPLPQKLVAPPTTHDHQGKPSPRSNRTPLTQAALQTHTERSRTFENRNQQTRAALLRPPTPPQVIPLADFQALPRERTHDRSPGRPAPNLPAGQRLHLHTHPHHHRNTGHTPHAHHNNRHQAHHGNPQQNQTRRERPH